jgi:hypothetical protein
VTDYGSAYLDNELETVPVLLWNKGWINEGIEGEEFPIHSAIVCPYSCGNKESVTRKTGSLVKTLFSNPPSDLKNEIVEY